MKTDIALEFIGVNKRYGAVHASRDLTFAVRRGSVHGIVGENGAGKSTAMKLLFGLERPDSGILRVGDREVDFASPTEAMAAGLGMVHQHFMLAGPFTALDNLLLAEGGHPMARLGRSAARQRYSDLAARYGFQIDFDLPVEDLPVGVQQRLEILKVLARDPRILIFDEPTAVLTPQEVRDFFLQIRRLKSEGRTILIISHKLREIVEITDEVTVFRHGAVVASRRTAETSCDEIAELMIGRKDHKPAFHKIAPGKPVLSLKNLSFHESHQTLEGFDLEVRENEIIGVAGVEGNGQDLLIKLLTEGRRHRHRVSGEARLLNHDLLSTNDADLRAAGAAFFPEDRLRFGLLENRSAFENFLLGRQRRNEYRKGPFIDFAKLRSSVNAAFQEYDVQPPDPHLAIGRFSGGNQQKFVVARELSTSPKFLLAAQPSRGVDLGATRFIHGKIFEAKARGAGVLLISSELEELMELSDRIVVLYRGRILARFDQFPFDETRIGLAMGGREVEP